MNVTTGETGDYRGNTPQTYFKKPARTLQTLDFLEKLKILRVSESFLTLQDKEYPIHVAMQKKRI